MVLFVGGLVYEEISFDSLENSLLRCRGIKMFTNIFWIDVESMKVHNDICMYVCL